MVYFWKSGSGKYRQGNQGEFMWFLETSNIFRIFGNSSHEWKTEMTLKMKRKNQKWLRLEPYPLYHICFPSTDFWEWGGSVFKVTKPWFCFPCTFCYWNSPFSTIGVRGSWIPGVKSLFVDVLYSKGSECPLQYNTWTHRMGPSFRGGVGFVYNLTATPNMGSIND